MANTRGKESDRKQWPELPQTLEAYPKRQLSLFQAFGIRYNFSPSQVSTENLDYFWNERKKKSDVFLAQI